MVALVLTLAVTAVALAKGADEWKKAEGLYVWKQSAQYSNGFLFVKPMEEDLFLFEFKTMRGSEAEDSSYDYNVAGIFLVEDNGTGEAEFEVDKKPVKLTFTLKGKTIAVKQNGSMPADVSGEYDFQEKGYEATEAAATAILEGITPAKTRGMNIMYFRTFDGVFQAVESGLCKFGILPIENSSFGSVTQVYDLMVDHKFHIVKDYKLRISHKLLANHGTRFDDIREVYSHNQAIGQCSQFLKEHPDIKVNIVENTAVAAKSVADSGRKDVAAISSSDCQQLYGLESVRDDIQNTDNNYTRFICITKELMIFPGASKTSVMLALGHTPGALADTLAKFSSLGLNLTKIESRPIAGKDFEFMLYLDFEASVYSDEVIALLCELDAEPTEFAYLGTYI